MKKSIIALVLVLGAVFVFGQNTGPIDLILVLDTSSSMSASYQEVNAYMSGGFLREFLRIGDTFHLIPFSGKPGIDFARRIEGRGDLETLIGRMFLQYPLDPWSDIPAALEFVERYIASLPSRPKKIVFISDGDTIPAPGSSSRTLDAAGLNALIGDLKTRLGRQGVSFDYVRVVPGQPLANLPRSGRPPMAQAAPAQTAAAPKPATPQQTAPAQQTRPPQTGQTAQSPAQPASPVQTAAPPKPATPQQTAPAQGGQAAAPGQGAQTPPAAQVRPSQAGQTAQPPAQPTGPAQTAAPQKPATPQQTAPALGGQTTQGSPGAQTPGASAAVPAPAQTQQQAPIPDAASPAVPPANAAVDSPVPPAPSPSPAQESPITEPPARPDRPAEPAQGMGGTQGERFPLFIIGLAALGLLAVGLLIFLITRRLQGSPNRAMAQAASPRPVTDSELPPFKDHSKELANYAASRSRQRVSPYGDKPILPSSSSPAMEFSGGPLLLNLFVEDQNTLIGKRNIHALKSGYNFTIGGGKSDFLIFLVPMPSAIGEVRRDGNHCNFIPRKAKYFPDIGSSQVPDCIGKTIRVISDKNYEIRFRLERYEDPLIALNRLLNSIKVPG